MIVSHLLLILHKKIQFYIFMFEAWNVANGRKVQGGRILSQGTVFCHDVGQVGTSVFLNQKRQINWPFGDITTEWIEHKDHLWCLWDILECQQKKLFKGKARIISLFLSFVLCLAGWNMIVMCLFGVLASDNRMVCFCRKAFLKSDTVAGLTIN